MAQQLAVVMISLTLMRGLADPRLSPSGRLALTYLHAELAWAPNGEFRSVKIRTLALGICCGRSQAFRALAALEKLGYIESDPTCHKPKHYRLLTPASRTATTRHAA